MKYYNYRVLIEWDLIFFFKIRAPKNPDLFGSRFFIVDIHVIFLEWKWKERLISLELQFYLEVEVVIIIIIEQLQSVDKVKLSEL